MEAQLPDWHFKRNEYLKYKAEHKAKGEVQQLEQLDAVSAATENDSLDPANYIVLQNTEHERIYGVKVEINQPGDGNDDHVDQPSLVYSVQVDNRDPRLFHVLEIVGYPQVEVEDGKRPGRCASSTKRSRARTTCLTAHCLGSHARCLRPSNERSLLLGSPDHGGGYAGVCLFGG